jgi:predicted GTPase
MRYEATVANFPYGFVRGIGPRHPASYGYLRDSWRTGTTAAVLRVDLNEKPETTGGDRVPDTVAALADLSADQQRRLQARVLAESGKPLTIAIMGQTGVGKSSLLNTMFGSRLRVGDVRPTTKVPEPVTVPGSTGHHLTVWDMPGLGESARSDHAYLAMYRDKLSESDVVLWAIHADSRSTLSDASALDAMLAGSSAAQRRALVSKMTFILTKADLITPPPWIYLRDGQSGSFAPSASAGERITEKARYYQEMLIQPYGGLQAADTYLSDEFSIDDPRFQVGDYHVRYTGFMSESQCAYFSSAYPQYRAVFERLGDNHRVIPVSALFRYNLVQLTIAIVNKLGESAIGRFQRLTNGSEVTTAVPVSAMRQLGNIVIWDKRKAAKTFDLDDIDL